MSQDGSITLFDSNTLSGTVLTYNVSYGLSVGSTYLARVTVGDLFDTGTSDAEFTYDDGSTAFPSVANGVGSVYEVAINGVGYMLADHPDRELKYQRRVVPLDSPRLSTSETPFSQAIDRYTLASGVDWSDGAGQLVFDRDSSSSKAFRRADGIDPFTVPGSLRLVPNGEQKVSSAYATPRVVVAGSKLYVLTGTGAFSAYDDPTDVTATTFTIAAAAALKAVCSDGTYWYYADGANVYRNNTPADPGAAWSASNAEVIEWCGDRIVIARSDGTSTTPNVVAVMASAGTEVGGTQIWTLPAETKVTSITAGDGYIWWSTYRGDNSTIFAWQIGSVESYFTALEIPAGQQATNIGYYQGNVFIRTIDLNGRGIIYRAVPNAGKLTPSRVLEIPTVGGSTQSEGDFAGDDRYVYFSWRKMGETTLTAAKTGSGIGVIDLATGGWTKWCGWRQATTEGTGAVPSIVVWFGRPVFVINDFGCVVGDIDDGAGDDGTVNTGSLETSLIDLGTSLRKVWTELDVTFDPLPSGGQIEISYSVDGGVSYDALLAAVTAGTKTARWTLGLESDVISFKIKLTGTTVTPSFRTLTVRANPVGLADQILVLPINCADRVTGLNRRELPESADGAGARRARVLENLVQSRVQVQDVDWPITGTTQTYDMIAADVTSVGVFDPSKGRQSQAQITTVTLRRSLR
jgi:hypothetical protein